MRGQGCAVWLTLRPEMPYFHFRSLGIYRKSVITVFTKKNIFKALNEFLDETFVPRHGAAAAHSLSDGDFLFVVPPLGSAGLGGTLWVGASTRPHHLPRHDGEFYQRTVGRLGGEQPNRQPGSSPCAQRAGCSQARPKRFAKEPVPLANTNFRRASRKASTIFARPPSAYAARALPAAAAAVRAQQFLVLRK